jgi:L-amino acid N-acyltransferase
MLIRDATTDDVAAINGLYNAFVPTTTVAWTEDLEPFEVRAAWFARQHQDANPVLVVEVDGTVVAFAAYDDFRDATKWPGYRFTVEHTVYVAPSLARQGIGRALVEALMARATAQGKHVMIGAVDAENVESICFHERLGFTEVARVPEVGFKFGRWLHLVLMHRTLLSSHRAPRPKMGR